MRKILTIVVAGVIGVAVAAPKTAVPKAAAPITYRLAFTENFNGRRLDPKVWQRIPAGRPDWNRNMSLREDLIVVTNGICSLRGIKNDGKDPSDTRAVLTGGIMTKDRLVLQYGKVEFRMKLENGQQGAWPAVWMMPQKDVKGWPHDGEIDIVERLNSDDFVYQTVHFGDGASGKQKGHKQKGGKGAIKNGDWNVYALEWTPDEIVWKVNGKQTFSYAREGTDPFAYPWTTPFYLMIDMQLGGNWVGKVNEATLPVAMHVDWVKFYRAEQNGKPLGTFGKPK